MYMYTELIKLMKFSFFIFINIAQHVHPAREITTQSKTDNLTDDKKTDNYEAHDDHISTTGLQKVLLSVGAAAMAITNPWRGGKISPIELNSLLFFSLYYK